MSNIPNIGSNSLVPVPVNQSQNKNNPQTISNPRLPENKSGDSFVKQQPPSPRELAIANYIKNRRMQALQEQQKKDKWQNFKSNLSYAVGLASGLAIIAMVVHGIRSAKNGGKEQLNAIVGTSLNWVDFMGSKSVAPLDSPTTAKSLRKAFATIKNNMSLTQAQREYADAEEFANVLYLYGHGGVGKTYVAKQFAQDIGALFTCIKYPDLGSPFKDAASIRITGVFDDIISQALVNKDRKIVVCIDEIDALIKKVPIGLGAEDAGKSRAAVLTAIDKMVQTCDNVTVVATSNYHPQSGLIDEIALRRFNEHIEVPLPDKEQTLALLDLFLKKVKGLNPTEYFKSPEIDRFAQKLVDEGYSNGEIELICKNAKKLFGASVKNVADEDLHNHKFTVDFLEQALASKGSAASKTNELMDMHL